MKLKVYSLVLIGLFVFSTGTALAALSSPAQFDGYGWSPNIGWVYFGVSTYGVQIEPGSDGWVTGYAWSPNVGWIRFGGKTGCPYAIGGVCDPWFDFTTNQLYGWAHALHDSPGWDGWISLNGANHSGEGDTSYGVIFSPSTGYFSKLSYAWGSSVVGWLNFGGDPDSYSNNGVSINTPCSSSQACTADGSGYIYTDVWCEETTYSCSGSESCNDTTGACEGSGPGGSGVDLIALDDFITIGTSVDLTWNLDGNLPAECHITGPGISGQQYLDAVGDTKLSVTPPGSSVYTLTCPTGSDTVLIEVEQYGQES